MSDAITEDKITRFNRNEVDILRNPVRASMVDGTVLRGFYYEREKPVPPGRYSILPSNTPLLCLPTELGNSREYHEFALELTGLPGGPKRVYTLDFRGRGRSDLAKNDRSTTFTDAGDLISFCDAMGLHGVDILSSGRSVQSVFLAGPIRPSLVRKLILNDTGPELDSVGIARQIALRQRQRPANSWQEAVDNLKQLKEKEFPCLTEPQWEALARTIWRDEAGKPVPDVRAELQRMANAASYDEKQVQLWPEAKLFNRSPKLLIRGEYSSLFTVEIAQRLGDKLPKLQQFIAQGQGHVPILHLNGLVEIILSFLQGGEEDR